MRNYRNLEVWEKAHKLTLTVYELTKCFPRDETFGLRAQVRGACVSIPTNIAEGCGRRTDMDFARFLDISAGSANELDYLVFFSGCVGYLSLEHAEQLMSAISEIRKMLAGLISRLR
jgi:four helix bundle protein